MQLKVKIELAQASKKMGKRYRKRASRISPALRNALTEIGETVIKVAKDEFVPVRTGALQRSLDFVVAMAREGWRLVVGSGLTGGKQLRYAGIQEEGGVTGRGHKTVIKPQWYMRNSIRKVRSQMRRIYIRHMRRALK